eukprot:20871_1
MDYMSIRTDSVIRNSFISLVCCGSVFSAVLETMEAIMWIHANYTMEAIMWIKKAMQPLYITRSTGRQAMQTRNTYIPTMSMHNDKPTTSSHFTGVRNKTLGIITRRRGT